MVSYWYPPTPGAGSERAVGFVRHLPVHGWKPIVLTADSTGGSLSARWFGFGEFATIDAGVPVYRVPDVVGARSIQLPYAGPPTAAREHWLRRFVFPDRFVIWAGRAEREAEYGLGGTFPDVVWATFPPASAAMVGARLADKFSRPLVLDLRDPWMGIGGYSPRSESQRERHEDLERNLARQAAAVTVISDAMRDDVCRRLDVEPERVHVIANGFDLGRCGPAFENESARSAELVHVGSVLQRNRPDLFLEALSGAAQRGRLSTRVRFVGNVSAGYLASLGLAAWVSASGMVPWDAAWRETCSADALLLLVGEYVGKWGHNTKLFEYLRSGRPILCLEERGGSNDRRLLEELAPRRAMFGSLHDPESIVDCMDSVMRAGRENGRRSLDESERLKRFDRARLAARLAEILDFVMIGR